MLRDNNCTLFNGDCLKILPSIKEHTVDLILTDLPYGITANRWDKPLPLDKLWKQYKRVLKEDGIICLFAREPFTSKLISSNPEMFRYKLIWDKVTGTGFLNCSYRPLSTYEEIIIFSSCTIGSRSKRPIRYFPQGVIPVSITKRNNPNSKWRTNMGYSGHNSLNSNLEFTQRYTNFPTDILRFARDRGAVHPTQKPVALCEWLIRTFTKQGELVMDTCMGSGTVGVACRNTEREFIGIELSTYYFGLAENRIIN
ncbi:MAG: site-specific DNA-methyltransferase [Clostridiales bacterium]|nr:site-specific DNA-methyltransferase [Clostridiales bacterium]